MSDPATLAKYRAAIEEHGSVRAAERALGLGNDSIGSFMRRQARLGQAPGHFENGVAPGYRMGKVTVQRANGVVERTWERQSPDQAFAMAALQSAVEAMRDEVKPVPAMEPPRFTVASLCNLYTITDYHFGMAARVAGGGPEWNLEIAEDLLVRIFENLISRAPAAGTAILNQLGDLMHYDGLLAVTPTHGHVLDAAARYDEIVQVVIRAMRRVIAMLLTKHERVHIIMAEGNHDLASSVWLRQMFAVLYENEPRVTVDTSPLPYYAFQFGKCFLGFHHGHKKKVEALPLVFVGMFRELVGKTKAGWIHTGHWHHVNEKEHPGFKLIGHPTLAAPDNHSMAGGWISEREASVFTYHEGGYQVGRTTATPEMLQEAA